jgi:hypothetical protein
MIYFQLQDGDDSQLLISADGIESIRAPDRATGRARFSSPPEPDWTIELGGSEADPGRAFLWSNCRSNSVRPPPDPNGAVRDRRLLETEISALGRAWAEEEVATLRVHSKLRTHV